MPALSRRAAMLSTAVLASGASPAQAKTAAALVDELDKKATERNAQGAPEKHLPKISAEDIKGIDLKTVAQVTVSVPHVMDPEKTHFIQYVWLRDQKNRVIAVKAFKPNSPSPPTLTANVPKGTTVVPLLFCNLHGVWEGVPFKVEV